MQLKTVFDSNIYVAAALKPGGYADMWLDIAALPQTGLKLFTSQPILDEVQEKLVLTFGLPALEVDCFIERLKQISLLVDPKEKIDAVKDDPDDNMILECGVAAKAQLIISADKHLLRLYLGIGIAHPRELKNIFASDIDIKK
jgi:putative PIN family toxin of toxin-antitoxin system